MKPFLVSVAVSSFILTAGCQQPTVTSLSTEDLEAVKALGRAYQDAINAENVDGIVAAFAPDGISLPPGWEPLQGREEIRRFWEGQVTGVSGTGSSQTMAMYGANGLAYDLGTYTYTYTDSAGVTTTRLGKFLGVYRKQTDGSWKIVADMWNLTPAPSSGGRPAVREMPPSIRMQQMRAEGAARADRAHEAAGVWHAPARQTAPALPRCGSTMR